VDIDRRVIHPGCEVEQLHLLVAGLAADEFYGVLADLLDLGVGHGSGGESQENDYDTSTHGESSFTW
jgi:hypothetical protein